MVEETRERVGLRLVLEPRTTLGVVERERGGVREALRELELVVRERAVFADAVDVEHALDLSSRDERNRDQRLGIDRRPRHEANTRVEVRLVDERSLAAARRPTGDAFVETDARPKDLRRVLVAGEHGHEHGLRLVRLVDRQGVVRDEVGESVGDANEQRVEGLLGQDLVEEVGEPPVRLDELGRVRRAVALRQKPEVGFRARYQHTPGGGQSTGRRLNSLVRVGCT